MARRHGPWTIQSTTPKYENAFITVTEDQVIQPDGQPGIYGTVRMKPGVAVLPIDERGMARLTRQFRYALGRESIEVVAGALDESEPALEAARREVREELGVDAGEWIDLGVMDIDTSIVHCPVHLFVARQLSFAEPEREGTETMSTLRVPFEEAVQMVMASTITHSPSCVLILKARELLQAGTRSR